MDYLTSRDVASFDGTIRFRKTVDAKTFEPVDARAAELYDTARGVFILAGFGGVVSERIARYNLDNGTAVIETVVETSAISCPRRRALSFDAIVDALPMHGADNDVINYIFASNPAVWRSSTLARLNSLPYIEARRYSAPVDAIGAQENAAFDYIGCILWRSSVWNNTGALKGGKRVDDRGVEYTAAVYDLTAVDDLGTLYDEISETIRRQEIGGEDCYYNALAYILRRSCAPKLDNVTENE